MCCLCDHALCGHNDLLCDTLDFGDGSVGAESIGSSVLASCDKADIRVIETMYGTDEELFVEALCD